MKKLLILTIIISLVGCSKSKEDPFVPDCSGAAKSFSTDVNPIFQGVCATSNCHAAGSNNGPGALTNYQQVFNNRSAIRTAVANGTMPQNSSLTAAQKNAILCWIDSGAPNN
jgi:hypothetical protein